MAKIWLNTAEDGDLSNAANWDGATLPVDGDSIVIDNSDASITLGLSEFAGLTFTNLNIGEGFTGLLGDVETPAIIPATIANINAPRSRRINIDNENKQTTTYIQATSDTSYDQNKPTCRIKGSHADNKILIQSGSVGIGMNTNSETATMSSVVAQSGESEVYIGRFTTITDIAIAAPATVYNLGASISGIVSIINENAVYDVFSYDSVTTHNQIDVRFGLLNFKGKIDIGTLNNMSKVDFSKTVGGNIAVHNIFTGGTVAASMNWINGFSDSIVIGEEHILLIGDL